MWLKLAAMFVLFSGEALAIYAEVLAAQRQHRGGSTALSNFIASFPLAAVAAAALVGGYMLGIVAFRSIWVVAVISITSIVIIEPALAWTLFHEIPSRGAMIGMLLGVAGLIVSQL